MTMPRLLPTLALLLSGCAGGQQAYPSLAKRPVESAPVAAPAPAATPAPADAPLRTQIDQFTAQAAAGSASFDKAYGAADKAVRAASGASVSADSWVAAQVTVSAAEAARNDSVSALASLDTLYVERTDAIADGKAQGGIAEIDAARAAALAIVDSQNDRIDALKGRLRQP